MASRARARTLRRHGRLLATLILLLGLAPPVALSGTMFFRSPAKGTILDDGLALLLEPSTVTTFVVAVAAGALALVIGAPLGALLASNPSGHAGRAGRIILLGMALAPAALPPVLFGGIVATITKVGPVPPRVPDAALLNWLLLSIVWGLAFAPLTAVAVAVALERLPPAETVAARALLPRRLRFAAVLAPRLRAPLAVTAIAAAAMAAQDASTPPHLGVETLATRSVQHFQMTLDAGPVAAAMLPPWLGLALLLALLTRPLGFRLGNMAESRPPPAAWAWIGTAGVAFVTVAMPLAWCLQRIETAPRIGRFVPELAMLGELVLVGGAAAAVIALLALVATAAAHSHAEAETVWSRARSRFGVFLPLCAPGLVVALGVVAAVGPLGGQSDEMAWWGTVLLRASPWAGLAVTLLGRPPELRAALALGMAPGPRVRLALKAKSARLVPIAALAAAAAIARETDLAAAFALPGHETPAMRAAQLLHYGFGQDVAELIPLQLAGGATLALLFALALGRPMARHHAAPS